MVRGASTATAGAALPLQWPLVGRHEELELFTATLADARAHGFVIHGAAGRGQDPPGRSVPRPGRPGGRGATWPGPPLPRAPGPIPLGALAHLLPAGTADERAISSASWPEVRAVLREQATGGPLVLFVDDLHLLDATSATLVGQLVDADLRVPASGPCGTAASLPAWSRVPVAAGPGASHRPGRPRPRRRGHAAPPGAAAVLSRPARSPRSGRPAGATSCSSGSWCSVPGATASLVDQHGVWRLAGPLVATPRLHDLVAARLGEGERGDQGCARPPGRLRGRPVSSVLETLVGGEQLEPLDQLGAAHDRRGRSPSAGRAGPPAAARRDAARPGWPN